MEQRFFFVCISEEAFSKARAKKKNPQLVFMDETLSHVLVGERKKKKV